jgi:hypothetical protein
MRSRHTAAFLAYLLILGGGVWAFASAPRVAFAHADHTPHVLAASAHLEAGVVARPLRSPLPYASTVRACDALPSVEHPARTLGSVPTAHRHAPLYALLRVYRL